MGLPEASRPSEPDASSATPTPSFKSCDSPRTAASVESLTAGDDSCSCQSGGGRRWPSVSRIPQLVPQVDARRPQGGAASGPTVSKDSDGDNSPVTSGESTTTAATTQGMAAAGEASAKPVRLTSSTAVAAPPERRAGREDMACWLPAQMAAFRQPTASKAVADTGRLRVRSESPSR